MALRRTLILLTSTKSPIPSNPPVLKDPAGIKQTVLEVERKFRRLTVPTLTGLTTTATATTATSSSSCRTIMGSNLLPFFQSVRPLPTRHIHDIYYDTPQRHLNASGAWVRLRNGKWQAKVKRGGDFLNSRFEELQGEEQIAECVNRILSEHRQKGHHQRHYPHHDHLKEKRKENFGLVKLAEFVTTRETWVVDGEFTVVRDTMDFGHEVGEVELQVEVARDKNGGGKGVEAVMEEMDRRIEEFMKRYSWAWEEGEAVGKLTAYFEMVKARKIKMDSEKGR